MDKWRQAGRSQRVENFYERFMFKRMTGMEHTIGFIGAGNMGEAIIGAVIRSALCRPENIFAADIQKERLDYLNTTYGIRTTDENITLFTACDIIFLAVKPQQMASVLSGITSAPGYGVTDRKIIVSIAAGVNINKLESVLYAKLSPADQAKLPIIRVMPNTPALVLKGMSGMSPNAHADTKDLETAGRILKAMGQVIQFDETDLDAVTAMSGSGPAYVFFLAELMIKAGIRIGLNPDDAKTLTLATLEGAVALMNQGTDTPEQLRSKVTSPGGTTEAALNVMTRNQVDEHIVDAIIAAAERSRELSQ